MSANIYKLLWLSATKPLTFIIISVILSACTILPGKSGTGPVTLKFWGLWESSPTVNKIVEDYKKIKPNVTVLYEKKAPQQYRESLEAQIASGKGPDIFVFHNTWVPMLTDELAPIPSSVISADEFKKNYYPIVFKDLRNSQKKFIGAPTGIDGLVLYWNEDIFKAAGVARPPATWPEFTQIAQKFTVKDGIGNIRTAGAALGTAANVDHYPDILGLMILQNGGDPKAPTDKKASDALEYYTNFAKGANRVWDETLPSSTVAFVGGNLAMYFGPSWRAIEIKNANPLLKFKAAPVPQLEGGKLAWASYWAVGVSAKSSSQDQAFEFLKFLQQDQAMINLYSEAAKNPGRFFGEPYPKVSLGQKLSSDPIVGALISQAPYMTSFPMASRTFDNGLNDQIIKAYEDAINSVLKGTPPATALTTTAKNVANVMSRYSAAPSK